MLSAVVDYGDKWVQAHRPHVWQWMSSWASPFSALQSTGQVVRRKALRNRMEPALND